MLLTIAGWVVFGFLVGVVVEIVRPAGRTGPWSASSRWP